MERALRLNLELLTEQAQLALMAHNPALFNHSLERAAAWLERYYRVDPAASAELATAFRTLAATTIRAELPELGAARRALATYLDGRRPGGAAGAADTGGASQ